MSSKNENLDNNTRLFNKVMAIPKKKMSQAEKIMFSYIISYCLEYGLFEADNNYISRVLGDKVQSVTDYITRLHSMGLIKVDYKRSVTKEGNYHGTKRYITVVNMEGWTEKTTSIPEVPLIPKKNCKKKDSTDINVSADTTTNTSINTEIKPVEPVIDTITIAGAVNHSAVPEAQPIETEGCEATTSSQNSDDSCDLIILNANKDIDTNGANGNIIISKIKNKEEVKFQKVKVKFDDDEPKIDEATLLKNGKYFLKATLEMMDKSLFE